MKKIAVTLMMIFCAGIVYAEHENISTSQYYVDAQASTKQDAVPANNANSVMTYDSASADGIGSKAIYNPSSSYAGQSKALVTASTANTAIQNGINNEFVCKNPPECTLWRIRNKTQQTILPSGYTALEYIESAGTQYIDTGYALTTDDFEIMGTGLKKQESGVFFGARLNATQDYKGILESYTTYGLIGFWGNSSATNKWFSFAASVNQKYTFKIKCNNNLSCIASCSGFDEKSFNALQTYVNGNNIYIFRNNPTLNTNYGGIQLSALSIKNNGNLVRDFIPARRDSDNELGMYDMVTNTFFTNSGDGEFIAGPVVNLYMPQNQQ